MSTDESLYEDGKREEAIIQAWVDGLAGMCVKCKSLFYLGELTQIGHGYYCEEHIPGDNDE
jgi:hypothetical protein